MMKKPTPMIYKIVTVLALSLVAGFVLFGCARPQPMGEGLDIGLRHFDKQRSTEGNP